MQPIPAAEIRERFLAFFEARGHKRLPSDSLVPANDPTLLFTGAGMNQFKDMFLGVGSLPYKRVCTAQKCLRVPDLDMVGRTPRHHTFFEMLGNFSFGDYFKKECIAWEWEFFSRELGIPPRRMVVTVYEKDDEAYEVWHRVIGLEPERIFRFGEKENFWPAEAPSKGPDGPCGPCSEIYFDAAPDQPYPARDGLRALPEDRFTEIGNCVFTQYDRRADGTLAPLRAKNIDVGLGLERIAAVLAGARNNFETDLFLPLLDYIAQRCGRRYRAAEADDVRMRRISDHARALVFCIADGALPSNEGRGYVVRKILRRACRDGYELGIRDPFLHELVDVVGQLMGDAYPEVRAHAAQCRSIIRGEEESFATVYRQGMARLEEFLAAGAVASARASAGKASALAAAPGSGEFAFQLHDTYGFPVDITRQVLAERGLMLDDAGFEAAMAEQRRRAREAMATTAAVFAGSVAGALRGAGVPATEFVGYTELAAETVVRGLVGAGDRLLERAAAGGGQLLVVVERTPFYAQGGGQVGDRGVLYTETGRAAVVDVTAVDGYYLHRVELSSGEIAVGQPCRLEVDEPLRRATERNHTATHLLHAALKRVLGPHVSQAGSEVAPSRLRFDFTHGEKLTAEQIDAIEQQVNEVVMAAREVRAVERPAEAARREGFIALFGEKYGDRVRTLAVGDYSKELCGGTHVANSGNIGLFRIVAETAVSAGTRRIEAVTGPAALALARQERQQVDEVARLLKVPASAIAERVAQLQAEIKHLRKQLDRALAPDPASLLAELRQASGLAGGVHCAVHRRDGLDTKQAQDLLSRACQALSPFVGVVFSALDGQVVVVAAVSPELTERVSAADLVRVATQAMGGGGGGRPALAQGRGKDAGKLAEAQAAVREALGQVGLLA